MTQYDNNNKITVFKNDKQGNDQRPDMTGKVNVEGKEFYVSLWTRTPNNGGDKFLSGQIKPVEVKEEPKKEAVNTDDIDDEICF
jgi:hypothetical protein